MIPTLKGYMTGHKTLSSQKTVSLRPNCLQKVQLRAPLSPCKQPGPFNLLLYNQFLEKNTSFDPMTTLSIQTPIRSFFWHLVTFVNILFTGTLVQCPLQKGHSQGKTRIHTDYRPQEDNGCSITGHGRH